MLAIERRRLILDRLLEEGQVVVRDLARQFGVSEETIRRDLERFGQEGLATRSYGGAVLKDGAAGTGAVRPGAGERLAGEESVGAILSELVDDGTYLFLDPGTMARSIIRNLRQAGKKDLTILTNAVEVLVACDAFSDWDVISLGGSLQAGKSVVAGPQTVEWIGDYHADKAIVCCRALDRKRGVTDSGVLTAQVKRAMLQNAGERIVVVEGSMFGQAGFYKVCGLEEIDAVVTDTAPPAQWMEYLNELGIRCHCAP